ncbi:MAG: hypothetical protein HKK67_08110 [Chlorobiaceae bacterium]|nr:hypothetical protein [Chlorobiaceae bacterium]
MGVKELFLAIFSLLFRYGNFWNDLKKREVTHGDEFNVLRDYAVPVIALVQLAKFPLIGLPRPAMFFAIANFLIDIAGLYLMMGGAAYLFARENTETPQGGIVTVFCYSMTPVWLFELFYFTGRLSWLFAFIALSYALVIGRKGLAVMLDVISGVTGNALRNTALFVITVNTAVFLLIRAVMRLFNF